MRISQTLTAISAAILVLGFQLSAAIAATRTVCVHLAYNDDRVDCPAPGTTGARYTCQPANGWSTALGHTLELWDKDPTGGDEFIGYFVTGRTPGSASCFAFEWENASYSLGEANPDVYIRYRYEASGQANGLFVQAQDENGNRFTTITWRNGTSSNSEAHVAMDCTNGSSCWINGGGILYPNSSGSSPETVGMGGIDAAAAALVPFISVEDINPSRLIPLKIYTNACSGGCANIATIWATWTKATQPEVMTHEMGHVMQFRAVDNELGGNDTNKNDPSGSWGMWSDEHEEVTLVEGFATYVGVVSYYDPQVSAVVPIFGGSNVETNSFTNCSTSHVFVGSVIRGLWDIDDINNESAHASVDSGYADATSIATPLLMTYWTYFPSGTGNRQRQESDVDGPNIRDYAVNSGLTTTGTRSLIDHNCLEGQDNN
jgi:hypothetical protein